MDQDVQKKLLLEGGTIYTTELMIQTGKITCVIREKLKMLKVSIIFHPHAKALNSFLFCFI